MSEEDQELIRQERTAYQRSVLWILIVGPMGIVLGGAAGWIMALARRGVLPLNPHHAAATAIGLALLVAIPTILLGRRFLQRPSKEVFTERIMRKHVDDLQRRFVLALLVGLMIVPTLLWVLVRETVTDWAVAAEFCFTVCVYVLLFTFGPFVNRTVMRVIDDELARAHKAAALRWTYPATMAVFIAAYLASLYAPGQVHVILPSALAFGALAPVVVYAVSQWRAERDG